jgi:ABC-type multidrug transport system fused ATPase/permease subunit
MKISPSPAAVFYKARHTALAASIQTVAQQASRSGAGTLLTLAAAIFTIALSLFKNYPNWLILIPLAVGAVLLRSYLRTRREHDRLLRLSRLYDQAIARVDGTRTQSEHAGEAFREPAHLYDRDLQILGPDSLFGLLATVRTGVGQAGLAHDLLHPPAREQTLERQSAIQELAPNNNLREQIHLLGVSQFQQVAATFFNDWLDTPPPTFHPAFRYILVLTSTILVALLILGGWHLATWSALFPNLLGVLAIQSAIGLYLRSRVLPILKQAAGLANQMQMFSYGLALLQSTKFRSPKLLALQQISREPDNAVPAIKKLQSQLVIVEQRTKEWFLLASLLLSAGTHAALSIAAWKRRHAPAMKQWLTIWSEFESLNALATYAYEHPDNIYPEILPTGTATFEATALAHPLLQDEAVSNDIALTTETSLYLISGSNMAGKSTLLRSIGLNAVLAAVGAPIRATTARIAPLTIGASLAIADSLAEGKSKFLAEVERLHAILQLTAHPTPVLFLIDEIFSGTNSLDRRIAAEAVARSLIAHNAIGALSTHDLTLTEMATNPALRATNHHMASPDPADPLAFDYRLKPGPNPSSNALAILRLIGIEL